MDAALSQGATGGSLTKTLDRAASLRVWAAARAPADPPIPICAFNAAFCYDCSNIDTTPWVLLRRALDLDLSRSSALA